MVHKGRIVQQHPRHGLPQLAQRRVGDAGHAHGQVEPIAGAPRRGRIDRQLERLRLVRERRQREAALLDAGEDRIGRRVDAEAARRITLRHEAAVGEPSARSAPVDPNQRCRT